MLALSLQFYLKLHTTELKKKHLFSFITFDPILTNTTFRHFPYFIYYTLVDINRFMYKKNQMIFMTNLNKVYFQI